MYFWRKIFRCGVAASNSVLISNLSKLKRLLLFKYQSSFLVPILSPTLNIIILHTVCNLIGECCIVLTCIEKLLS